MQKNYEKKKLKARRKIEEVGHRQIKVKVRKGQEGDYSEHEEQDETYKQARRKDNERSVVLESKGTIRNPFLQKVLREEGKVNDI